MRRPSTPRRGILLFIVIALVSVAPASSGAAQRLAERARALTERVRAEERLPGVSAALSVDGKIVWSGGSGYADLENLVPATEKTVYRIASISKSISAVAIMQLVERGKINLDDDIRTIVPYFPRKRWPVSLRHLMTHTSGIRHYKPGEFGTKEHYDTVKEALAVFMNDPLLFEPGTRFSYSTFGYNILAAVIEEVTGLSFEAYLRKNVWGPAGMTATRLEKQGDLVPHRARGYVRGKNGNFRNAPFTDVSLKWAGGGMISTVEDLLRFARAVLDGTLIKASTLQQMLTPYELKNGKRTNYGLGFALGRDEKKGRVFGHAGGSTGFSSRLFIYPDVGIAVAVMTNLQGAGRSVTRLAQDLADLAVVSSGRRMSEKKR